MLKKSVKKKWKKYLFPSKLEFKEDHTKLVGAVGFIERGNGKVED